MSRRTLVLDRDPDMLAILDHVARRFGTEPSEIVTRSRQPYKSAPARARRVAMVAAYKQFENAKAIAPVFCRHVGTIWPVLAKASDDEHAVAGEIVANLHTKAA
jgi:hypothetical protein